MDRESQPIRHQDPGNYHLCQIQTRKGKTSILLFIEADETIHEALSEIRHPVELLHDTVLTRNEARELYQKLENTSGPMCHGEIYELQRALQDHMRFVARLEPATSGHVLA